MEVSTHSGQCCTDRSACARADSEEKSVNSPDADNTPYTADPPGARPNEVGQVNADGTGRRLYFHGPDGHMLDVLTARYNDVPPV